MKLKACYIEGYGKIKKQEYIFSDGLTTFFKENGEGKTTLASFIKAMFYGLKGYRKGSTEFCDREHFYPFDGGLFGGNLTFEMEGRLYKIERFFGDKSETADSLRVLVNGEEETSLGEDIGRAVFGVDRESFERTTFIDGGDVEIKSTSGIHARLNAFLEGGEEDGGFDEAIAALEKAAKVYKKSKAGNDKITAEALRIAKLNEGIENATAVKNALEGKYARLAALHTEIAELNEQIVAAQTENERLTQFEHYDSLEAGVARAQTLLQSIALRYPFGLPTREETTMLNEYMVASKALQAKLDGMEFSLKDEEKLSWLAQIFRAGVPSEESLLTVEKQIQTLSETETEIQIVNGYRKSAEEEKLSVKFAHGCPSEEVLSETADRVAAYKKVKAEYEQTPAWLVSKGGASAAKLHASKKYAVFAAVAFLVLIAGGIALTAQTILGAALLGVGGAALLIDGFLYLNHKTGSAPTPVSVENIERKRLENRLREIEDSVKALLLPYGYHSEEGIAFDFATLQKDCAMYRRMKEGEQVRVESVLNKKSAAQNTAQGLTAFFRNYGLSGDTYVKLLSDLRLRVSDYADLAARKHSVGQGKAQVEAELLKLRGKIEGYRSKYGLKELLVSGILEDVRAVERLQREIADGQAAAKAYREEKGLTERSDVPKTDLASLQATLTERQNERSKLEREISADETEAEKLDGYEAEKAEAEESLRTYKRKHRLLTATAEQLHKAEGRLKDKYVRPIKEEFVYYARLIETALEEKLIITKDFELRFERNGVERSEKHLSAGQRSICALCFRLALVKNMYRGRLPFLILDDPFASLDETHLRRVRSVLQALSKDMQMIYFTCHESRLL